MPTVTIVFLVYNRREELRTSLGKMLRDSDVPAGQLDVVVVDNASEDGSAEMVADAFPEVRVVRRDVNVGVSGWNDGFAVARGDYVLALDDDCYLPPDGLRRAVEAAEAYRADLVSFSVRSLQRPDYSFSETWIPGLLAFWGCAVLVRRPVLERLGGYDPAIFVWANELEFTMRFFDAGFRHLHLHEVEAVHMKDPGDEHWTAHFRRPSYRINAEHFAYIAAKLLAPRDAAAVVMAMTTRIVLHGLLLETAALRALPPTLTGLRRGLRRRRPLASREVSSAYRHNFHPFAAPWRTAPPPRWVLRTAADRLASRVRGRPSREPDAQPRDYFAERAAYYPSEAATLQF